MKKTPPLRAEEHRKEHTTRLQRTSRPTREPARPQQPSAPHGEDGLRLELPANRQNLCPLQKKHCGGCQLVGIPYPQQLALKQDALQKLLGKFGAVRPILPMQEPLHYRNKVVSTFATGWDGKLTSGMYAAWSHKVLPVQTCLLQDETADKTVEAVRVAARRCKLEPFDEDAGRGMLRHCLVRVGKRSGQVMVVLVTVEKILPGSRAFVAALRQEAERRGVQITTVIQNINPRHTSVVLGSEEKVLFGPGRISDTLCGLEFGISPRSFYQVNPVQTELLYRTALELAGLDGSQTVVDAYCGIGTIALAAAGRAKQVLGIELNAAAVRDAAANARRNKIGNASFFCADATEHMAQLAQQGARADVVFLDPPREGTTPQCIQSIAALAPKKVVYISCGPASLARDLAEFAKQGYRPQTIQPVDLFPQTNHVEVICCCTKR